MAKAKSTKPQHLMGAVTRNGYSREGDVFYISPGNASTMESIQEQYSALNAYIAAINEYIVPRFGELAKRKTDWWKTMAADVQHDLNDYQFNLSDRSLKPAPKKESHD